MTWQVPNLRILHGYGRPPGTLPLLGEYEQAGGGEPWRRPVVLHTWVEAPGIPGREADQLANLAAHAAWAAATGGVLCLTLNFGVGDYTSFGAAPDDEVASGAHDGLIVQFLQAASAAPAGYLVLGGEVNGWWRGHWTDGTFLAAWAHVRELAKQHWPGGHVTWVCETMGEGPDNWEPWGLLPEPAQVDRYGIDLYFAAAPGSISAALFGLAAAHGSRVLVGEAAPWGWSHADQTLEQRWWGWFAPALSHCLAHAGRVEAWVWVPDDFTAQYGAHAGDCRWHLPGVWSGWDSYARVVMTTTAMGMSFLHRDEWAALS
jgi:hypothetical protein